jgi:hypothetical protein
VLEAIADQYPGWEVYAGNLPSPAIMHTQAEKIADQAKALIKALTDAAPLVEFFIKNGIPPGVDGTPGKYENFLSNISKLETAAREYADRARLAVRPGAPANVLRAKILYSLIDHWQQDLEQPLARTKRADGSYSGPLVLFIKAWCDVVVGQGEISTYEIGDFIDREKNRQTKGKPRPPEVDLIVSPQLPRRG